jgi:hypothetical protein
LGPNVRGLRTRRGGGRSDNCGVWETRQPTRRGGGRNGGSRTVRETRVNRRARETTELKRAGGSDPAVVFFVCVVFVSVYLKPGFFPIWSVVELQRQEKPYTHQ